jgi:hypothetical protein
MYFRSTPASCLGRPPRHVLPAAWLASALALAMASACSTQTPGETSAFAERHVPLTSTTMTSFQDGALPWAGYAGTRDTYLSEAQTTANFGTNTALKLDGDDPPASGKDLAVLLSWSLASIPAGSVVTGANVTINVTDVSVGTWSVYGLERPWSEVGATWLVAEVGTPWGSAGAQGVADRGAQPPDRAPFR